MAMCMRLDDDDTALLKAPAEAEHISLHEAALRAIRRSARELAHTDRVREATSEMLGRWGEVLDQLGREGSRAHALTGGQPRARRRR